MTKKGQKQTEEHKRKRLLASSLSLKGRKCPWVSIANSKRKNIWSYRKITINCLCCGKKIIIRLYQNKRKFCSRNCFYLYNNIHNKERGKTIEEIHGHDTAIIIRERLRQFKLGKSNPTLSKLNKLKCGSNHPNWLGGKSFKSYGPIFNNIFKQQIKARDNYKCIICNKSKEKRDLNIHHIDYNKKNTSFENCCSLCQSCHMKTNYKRKYYTLFFRTVLKDKYNYNYVI